MDNNTLPKNEKQQLTEVMPKPNKLPDEITGIHIEAKFKITDPETGQVIVEGRA